MNVATDSRNSGSRLGTARESEETTRQLGVVSLAIAESEPRRLPQGLQGRQGDERRGARRNSSNRCAEIMEVILMIKKDEIAYLLLRLTLGANIFLHGFSRLVD
jgi:hypothetical protein